MNLTFRSFMKDYKRIKNKSLKFNFIIKLNTTVSKIWMLIWASGDCSKPREKLLKKKLKREDNSLVLWHCLRLLTLQMLVSITIVSLTTCLTIKIIVPYLSNSKDNTLEKVWEHMSILPFIIKSFIFSTHPNN